MDDITRGEKQQKYRNGPRIVFGVQRKRKKSCSGFRCSISAGFVCVEVQVGFHMITSCRAATFSVDDFPR